MNRKLINGFMAVALMFGAAAMVSSCKDVDEDLWNKSTAEDKVLSNEINTLKSKLNNVESTLGARVTALEADIAALQAESATTTDLTNLKNELLLKLQDYALISYVDAEVAKALKAAEDSTAVVAGAVSDLKTVVDNLNTKVEGLEWINDYKSIMPAVRDSAFSAAARALRNEAALEALDLKTTQLYDSVADLRAEAMANLAEAKAYADSLFNSLNYAATIKDLKNKIAANNLDIAALKNKVKKNSDAISALTQTVDALAGRLNKLITSIIPQATFNPVFGTVSLPFDLRSNILLSYYSQPGIGGDFPSIRHAVESQEVQMANAEALANIVSIMGSYPKFTYTSSDVFKSPNAGTLYLTLNPQGHDFSNVQLDLVRSDGKSSGMKLSPIEESNDLITFGYTYGGSRSAENGFYATTADVASYSTVKVDIENGLKQKAKDVLKDRNQSSLLAFAKVVYDQFNGILPALALRASWVADGKTYSNTSEYNIAATAFPPLSYNFLADFSTSKRIPTLNPIDEIKLNLNLKKFKLNATMNIGKVNLQVDIQDITLTADALNVQYTVPVYNETTGAFEDEVRNATVTNWDEFLTNLSTDLNNQLNEVIGDQFASDLNAQINDLIDDINNQFKTLLSDLEANVNSYIDEAIEEVTGQINDRLNGFLGRYNKWSERLNRVINKANKLIADPNHALQLTMVYEANGDLHLLSQSPALPSPARITKGNAIVLYPTSYTAEILAPSYKKYVAVSNVWRNGDASRTTVASVMKEANSNEFMNAICEGGRLSVPVKVQAGYTYEIYYTALDYQGMTATARFYLQVK